MTLRPSKPRARPSRAPFVFAALCAVAVFHCSGQVTFTEDFAGPPSLRGWHIFGDTNLFNWDGSKLAVTWDSSHTNSYFYFPVGTILSRHDDFSMALDLELTDVAAGINPAKSSTFELAFGFLNLVNVTKSNFFRGNGALSPNLVEFDYFPDTGFGPTIWPSICSTNSVLNYNGPSDYTLLSLPEGVAMRIALVYTASNRTLTTSIKTNGVAVGQIHNVALTSGFTDFRVGAFAIESYSDAGQDPQYGGSLLAHGSVDNITLTVPAPPIQQLALNLVSNQWQISFISRTNWLYALQRTTDLLNWSGVATAAGTGSSLILADTQSSSDHAFYRVTASRL
jgi:hypothetical protein